MSSEIRDRKEVDTAMEANSIKAKFDQQYWAYDGSATVWQDMTTGKWIVSMRRRDSCD